MRDPAPSASNALYDDACEALYQSMTYYRCVCLAPSVGAKENYFSFIYFYNLGLRRAIKFLVHEFCE